MNTPYRFDPRRPVLTFGDMRLTQAFQREPQRYASVNEYAAATDIPVDDLLDLLRDGLELGAIDIEAVGGEIFVHTAPAGRTGAGSEWQVAPNLWELLRLGHDTEEAFALWRITRDLQAAGWDVEANPQYLPTTGDGRTALLGLRFVNGVVPVVVFPEPAVVASQAGPLTRYEMARMGLAAVLCEHGNLDSTITAVRRWMLGRPARAGLDVLIAEAPRYQPVLLTSDDGGLTPRAVSVGYSAGSEQL